MSKKVKKSSRKEPTDVTPITDPAAEETAAASDSTGEQSADSLEPAAGGEADCVGGAEDAPAVPAEVAGDDAPAAVDVTPQDPGPPVMPVPKRPLAEISDELAETRRKLRSEESSLRAVKEDYAERIGILKAREDELFTAYNEGRWPITYDYPHGLKYYWDGQTGVLLRTEELERTPLEKRATDTIGNQPITVQPPAATFSQLTEGKVWEHEVHGCVRVLAVLEDSVRVRTDNLDEDAAGIEIGRADWDAHEAHPREVPDLAVGQHWQLSTGSTCEITALDDVAACVIVDGESTRISRLAFSEAGTKQIVDVADRLQVGSRVEFEDGCMAEVKAIVGSDSDRSILVEYENTAGDHEQGSQQQLAPSNFARAQLMLSRQEIASMTKKSKKGRKAKEAAE